MLFVTPFTISELAKKINAISVDGDSKKLIKSVNTISSAISTDITFLSNSAYRKQLKTTQAGCVILTNEDLHFCPENLTKIIVSDPRLALAQLMKLFKEEKKIEFGIHSSVVLGKDCNIHPHTLVSPNCVIGDNVIIESGVILEAGVVIGDNCILRKNVQIKANVSIYWGVSIGENTIIHSNTVIGSDGFGYANDVGKWVKIDHIGGVSIGSNVEIGSNTSIDRGLLDDTVISSNVIIDNLVQIAHNVFIGEGTAIAGCAGIAGSAEIGKYCLIGGGASIAGHIKIADKVHLTGTSSVSNSIENSGVYSSGFPAKENSVWRKNVARFQHLDSMARKIKQLEKSILTVGG